MKDATQTKSPNLAVVTCQHHWLIDPVAGPSSRGRCTRCGKEREFLNVFDDIVALQSTATPTLAVA